MSKAVWRAFAGAFSFWVGLIMIGGVGSSARAQVVLNEFMADNRNTLENNGSFPDWVELFNTGVVPMDLGGWSLTDDIANPRKFVFPAGTMVGAGQYLLVYCDTDLLGPGLHSGFALSDVGEILALYTSLGLGGGLRDYVSFGLQAPDRSVGRFANGTGPWNLNVPTPGEPNQLQTLAPAAGNLFINEWMANDLPDDDWLELYNAADLPVSLAGLIWSDSQASRALPNLSFISAGGFLKFIADDLESLDADHLNFKLSSTSGETVTLFAPDGFDIIDSVIFGPQSLSISEGRLPDGNANYVFFPVGRDTPGASNFLPLTNVVVNEVLPHTDPPLEDAIELVNLSAAPVDISHWWISNSKSNAKKFRVPPGTILQPGGFKVFYEYQFNPSGTGEAPSFTLNSARGDEVYIYTGDAAGNLTGYRNSIKFDASENAVSFGRYRTTNQRTVLVPMSQRSFGMDNPATLTQFRTGTGLTNPAPRVGSVVIHEMMYHPPDVVSGTNVLDNTLDEYVELHNLTEQTVLLYDPAFSTNTWRLANGITFQFPRFVSMPARSFLLVVNFDPATNATQLAAFRDQFDVAPEVPIFGPYGGKLDNREETIELLRPDTPQAPGRPDEGLVPYLYVDRLKYEDRDGWPESADGTGKSLQRLFPELFGDDPVNWGAAIPTPGSLSVEIDSVVRSGTGVLLGFRQVAGFSYAVQVSENSQSDVWSNLTLFPAQGSTLRREVLDTGVLGRPLRFYRLFTSP